MLPPFLKLSGPLRSISVGEFPIKPIRVPQLLVTVSCILPMTWSGQWYCGIVPQLQLHFANASCIVGGGQGVGMWCQKANLVLIVCTSLSIVLLGYVPVCSIWDSSRYAFVHFVCDSNSSRMLITMILVDAGTHPCMLCCYAVMLLSQIMPGHALEPCANGDRADACPAT